MERRDTVSVGSHRAPLAGGDELDGLGSVVMSCRDRSEKERIEAMGQGMAFYYFLPLVLPLVLCGLFLQALEKFGVRLSPLGARLLIGLFYTTICGWWFWQLFHKPSKPSLVLHERGFRYKRTLVPFSEVAAVRLGRELSAAQSAVVTLNRLVGRISSDNASAATLVERACEGSVTVVFNNGERRTLNGMLIRPEPKDVSEFLGRLRALNPDLVQ
jgi:hypothetical protein